MTTPTAIDLDGLYAVIAAAIDAGIPAEAAVLAIDEIIQELDEEQEG